jgi:hypothetical protein
MRGRRPCPTPSRKDEAREAAPIPGTDRAHLADQDIPAPADELADLLHAAFRELVGTDLATPVQREQYARGGMSSGMISPDTWRERLMPMSSERATARLPSLPRITGPPDTTLRYPIRYASPPSTRRTRRSASPSVRSQIGCYPRISERSARVHGATANGRSCP